MKHGSNHGVTLVEILVVMIMVSILAAVAVPIYTSYVTNQRQTVVNNLATTAAVVANAYLRRTGLDPAPDGSNLGLFFPDPTKYTVIVTAADDLITVRETADATITKTVSYQ